MKILYFDCFAGASGDMIVGALIDAGLPLDELREALASLPLDGVTVNADRVDRCGIGATKFRVHEGSATEGAARDRHPGHSHAHHHPHRGLIEISEMVDRSALAASVKTRAKRLFRRLAETEAAIHQQPVEKIHLHEVGAVDSIVDIVGSVFALEWLGADRIISSPLNVGSGTVQCEHGTLPVPAPATTRLIEGVPVYSNGIEAELLTPTGALLVTDYAERYGPLPAMRIRQIGYGAGDRDFSEAPNTLRVVVGDLEESRAFQRVVVIECEIDDMNPQIYGVLMDRLQKAGALEVFYAPIQMKKNRPGTLVTVIASPEQRDVLSGLLFRETTTIGVRFSEMDRERLPREQVSVDTPIGRVRFKIARRGTAVANVAPEFEDCARLATEQGLSVKDVYAIVTKAYLDWKP